MSFRNEVFLVSGSSSGIGKSCVEALLEMEALVIGLSNSKSAISDDRYLHYNLDVRDEQKVKAAIDEVDSNFGRIDGLVNCAGVYASSKPFYKIESQEWEGVISTNLTGVFMTSKYASLKMIKKNKGSIVNISCIRSGIFRPNMADYAASKGGVVALTSAMALDLMAYKIRVNSVAPGFTYTGMTEKSFSDPDIRAFSENIIPAGRIAKPCDIANAVIFLLTDKSGYINGETIHVDGGFRIWK